MEINDEHDYNHFSIAAAVATLMDVAKNHDYEGLEQASGYLDMSPTILLRGMAFLSQCLDAYEDAPPRQALIARGAIQEVTALCAVLLEIECSASIHRMMTEQEKLTQ